MCLTWNPQVNRWHNLLLILIALGERSRASLWCQCVWTVGLLSVRTSTGNPYVYLINFSLIAHTIEDNSKSLIEQDFSCGEVIRDPREISFRFDVSDCWNKKAPKASFEASYIILIFVFYQE